jgi:Fic family protein
VAADRARVLAREGTSVVALRLFELLPRHPVVTVASVMNLVETTKPTAGRAIELLVATGVLVETTGKKRERSFG